MKPILHIFFLSCFINVYSQQNDYELEFQNRAFLLLNYVSEEYSYNAPGRNNDNLKVPDPEKYNWPAVIARFIINGQDDSIANKRIELFKNNSPFHFTLIGMARIMSQFQESPSLKKNKKIYLKKVWERNDSYNAFWGEGTENHLNMSRTSAYIFAQHALEFPLDFPDAKERLTLMKKWIHYYSKTIYQVGVGEWNSSTYGLFNLIGWLNLYDFAEDTEVKLMARAVLDYYASEIALHYSWGMTGGSEMRGGSSVKSLSAITDFAAWLWFGNISFEPTNFFFEKNNNCIYAVHVATSNYRPNQLIVKLAQKKLSNPSYYYSSKPSYLLDKPSFIKETFYINNNYTLGTSYCPYAGFGNGNLQLINWKLVLREETSDTINTAYLITGQGIKPNPNGCFRTAYDQYAQHKNVMIQLTKVPENFSFINETINSIFIDWKKKWKKDFEFRFDTSDIKLKKTDLFKDIATMYKIDTIRNKSYVFIPSIIIKEKYQNDSILFIDAKNIYLAIRFLNGINSTSYLNITIKEKNYIKLIDTNKTNKLCGFVLEVFNKSEFSTFNSFIESINSTTYINQSNHNIIKYKSYYGDEINVRYQDSGIVEEPIYDYGYGVFKSNSIITSPPYLQPNWPQGNGFGRIPKVIINKEEFNLPLPWAVYSGPNFYLKESILFISDGENDYNVDYSNQIPSFNLK